MDDVAIVPLVECWFPFLRSRRVRGGEAGALAVTATPKRTSGARLLDARDLRVAFRTPDGVLEAVRGISLLPSGPVVQADRAAASSTGCCVCESPWGGAVLHHRNGQPREVHRGRRMNTIDTSSSNARLPP
jgi:hypothetical protein